MSSSLSCRADGYGEVRGRFLENALMLWAEAMPLGRKSSFCGDSSDVLPPPLAAAGELTDSNTLGAEANFEVAGRVAG